MIWIVLIFSAQSQNEKFWVQYGLFLEDFFKFSFFFYFTQFKYTLWCVWNLHTVYKTVLKNFDAFIFVGIYCSLEIIFLMDDRG